MVSDWGSPVGVLVKAVHVLEGSTARCQELGMAFSGKGVDHGPELLVWQMLQVESKESRTSDSKIRPDAPTMLSQGGDEEAHWTSYLVALIGLRAPGSRTAGRTRIHQWGSGVVGNGAKEPFGCVGSDDTLHHDDSPRMLGENAPGKLKSAEQNLAARLKGKVGGDVEGHRVGRVGAVGSDGLGDGGGKLGKQAPGRRRSFHPVKCGGKNQSGDNFDFAFSAPGSVA